MKIRMTVLALLAVTVGVFAYTRTHNPIPSDLRDAVADNGEFNTSIPVFEKEGGNMPVPIISRDTLAEDAVRLEAMASATNADSVCGYIADHAVQYISDCRAAAHIARLSPAGARITIAVAVENPVGAISMMRAVDGREFTPEMERFLLRIVKESYAYGIIAVKATSGKVYQASEISECDKTAQNSNIGYGLICLKNSGKPVVAPVEPEKPVYARALGSQEVRKCAQDVQDRSGGFLRECEELCALNSQEVIECALDVQERSGGFLRDRVELCTLNSQEMIWRAIKIQGRLGGDLDDLVRICLENPKKVTDCAERIIYDRGGSLSEVLGICGGHE